MSMIVKTPGSQMDSPAAAEEGEGGEEVGGGRWESGERSEVQAGVVVERGSEYILAHTGPRELDGQPLGGCGSGFGLVPGYTTLSVRVRANT